MGLILVTVFLISLPLTIASPPEIEVIGKDSVSLSRQQIIIAERVSKTLDLLKKGYISQEILTKTLKETEKSKHFSIFYPWLKELKKITELKNSSDLIKHCQQYEEVKEKLPLERWLETITGNFCREKTLETMGRFIDKNKTLPEKFLLFINRNLKFFLKKNNKKNFAYFINSQSSRPEIIKELSQAITKYSVQKQIVPDQEVLKDMHISGEITKLIQEKGFNPLQHKNVFYSEYGKLINQGYSYLENDSDEKKIETHFNYLKNYFQLNQDHLPSNMCLERLNNFAKAVYRSGFKKLSHRMFHFLLQNDVSLVPDESYFSYLWTHINENEYQEAMKVIKNLNLIKKSQELSDSRLKFWIAFVHEELKQKKTAISLYEELIINSPLSYYGIMANKKLRVLSPESEQVNFYFNKIIQDSPRPKITLKSLSEDHLSSLVRLRAWAKIDSYALIKSELKRLYVHSIPNQLARHPASTHDSLKTDLHLLHANAMHISDNYLASFRYLYKMLERKEVEFNRGLLGILYPSPYLKSIKRSLKKSKIDPIVVLSLMRQESVFNPRARSRVGATGLMQLMPTTAKRFRRRVRNKHLVDPNINIEIGTKYLNNLMKRYDGNLVYVLSAYNAGESRVKRWKKRYFNDEATILKNIETIPFLETRKYVKLIFRNIFFYKLLIENNQEFADSKASNQIFDVKLGFDK